MKSFLKIAVIGSALALAACGGNGDDKLGEQVEDSFDNKADVAEAMADNTADPIAKEELKEDAAAARAIGDQREKAIDKADVDADNMTQAQKNQLMAQ